MIISTCRFGDVNIDESQIITMDEGILGFDFLKRYVFLFQDEKNPFWVFQSVDDGKVSFVVINPSLIVKDYEPEINDDDIKALDIRSFRDAMTVAIVTMDSDLAKITANLRAPIVINSRNRFARQVILDNTDYPIKYNLLECDVCDEGERKGNGSPLIAAVSGL